MRLGINFVMEHETPEQWAEILVKHGYRSSVFPASYKDPVSKIDAYVQAAKDHDILIAEVGVWNSPHHPDKAIAEQARQDCLEKFKLADYVKANCCVNVSGAAGEKWYYCYPENYTEELYKRNVEYVQWLCDEVKPQHTNFALEPMQWMLPESVEQYAKVLKDVNREHFKVHMDVFNFINHPYLYTHQEELMNHAFEVLSKDIVSCHMKDIILEDGTTVAIVETEVGTGKGNLECYLQNIAKLDPDMPVLLEHQDSFEIFNRELEYLKKNYAHIVGK